MLNLFISFDLNSYAKSTINGIQHMQNFADQYPWLYEKFVTGFHTVIRQSDHHWCNVRRNLILEH